MNPEVQCRIHKGSPIIPILSRINPIPHIDTYLFKVHFNIVLLSTPRRPYQSSSEVLCNVSERWWFLQCEVVSLTPNPQAGALIIFTNTIIITYHFASTKEHKYVSLLNVSYINPSWIRNSLNKYLQPSLISPNISSIIVSERSHSEKFQKSIIIVYI